jgi:hypothetical protein
LIEKYEELTKGAEEREESAKAHVKKIASILDNRVAQNEELDKNANTSNNSVEMMETSYIGHQVDHDFEMVEVEDIKRGDLK